MQFAAIEYARNVAKLEGAHSTEFDVNTPHAIFDYLPDQYEGIEMGGTLRFGLYDCYINEGTKALMHIKLLMLKSVIVIVMNLTININRF